MRKSMQLCFKERRKKKKRRRYHPQHHHLETCMFHPELRLKLQTSNFPSNSPALAGLIQTLNISLTKCFHVYYIGLANYKLSYEAFKNTQTNGLHTGNSHIVTIWVSFIKALDPELGESQPLYRGTPEDWLLGSYKSQCF